VNTASWVVHPLTIIAHRAGRFSLGRMAGTAPVIPIDWPDLVLLGQFLTPTAPDQAATRVLNGPATAYLPGRPDPRALRQRFMQFRQGGVLIDGKPEPCADKRMSLTPDALEAAGALDEGQSLRLVRNFVLRPAASGLIVRSTRHDRDHLIDLEMALALALLGNGLTGQQVTRNPPGWLSREKFARVRQWALDEGLTKPAGKDNGERAAGDYRKQVPFRKATASDWRGLQPDGRIPVYFVPHMENHYPLALGMIAAALRAHDDGALARHSCSCPSVT
jgi:hypothetical protein